jgi:very-short-patch-repair endonuclease
MKQILRQLIQNDSEGGRNMPDTNKPVKIYYNSHLKEFSGKLRKESTLSEILLWKQLRASQMMGCRFNRQKSIGKYIVDFYCSKLKLVIEIDGESHDNKWDNDMERQTYLESIGLAVLRFDDLAVKQDMDNVLFAIEGWIRNNRLEGHPP